MWILEKCNHLLNFKLKKEKFFLFGKISDILKLKKRKRKIGLAIQLWVRKLFGTVYHQIANGYQVNYWFF